MATVININISGYGVSQTSKSPDPYRTYRLLPGFTATRELFGERKIKAKKKKNCSNGQVCGFSCISKTKVCIAEMTTAQLKEHNAAKRMAKGGGGVDLQSGINSSNTLEKKYTEILQKVSDAFEKYGMESDPDEKAKRYQEYSQLKEEKNNIIDRLKKAIVKEKNDQITKEEEEKRIAEKAGFAKMIAPVIGRGEAIAQKYLEDVNPEKTPIKAMKQIREKMIEQSRLSKEGADELANKVDLTSEGTKKGEQLRGMLSEFYQLTNGQDLQSLRKIEHFTDLTKSEVRASANQLFGRVTIGTQFLPPAQIKPILYHELGHHIEFSDRKKQDLAEAFVKSRAESSSVKLSKLTPGINYSDDEVAYPDKFIDPYVGKDYKGAGTEVISTGLEHFASPKSMANLYNKDKEHFYLLLGMIGDV